jgi:hypothetical protein
LDIHQASSLDIHQSSLDIHRLSGENLRHPPI